MAGWFRQVDDLLRGRRTVPQQLRAGRLDLPLHTFVPLAVVLGAIYGFFMGWYAILRGDSWNYMQLIASTVKLPALYLLTLVVTFPSLYVFNALVGCRLSFGATLRLLVGATVVNVTVAASLGPILGFFSLSTESYPFMIVLNVALLAIAGSVALGFLLHTLRRLTVPSPDVTDPAQVEQAPAANGDLPQAPQVPGVEPGPLDRLAEQHTDPEMGEARTVFRIWVIIYGLVGAQMGWLLRPFIGSPNMEFTWFRQRDGNFFQSVGQQLQHLFGG